MEIRTMAHRPTIRSRLEELLGFGLVAACLVLSLPGPEAVRAESESEPAVDARFAESAGQVSFDPSMTAEDPGPASCQAAAGASVTPQSIESPSHAESAPLQARMAEPAQADGQVIVLNSRGYNYEFAAGPITGPPTPSVPAAIDPAELAGPDGL